MELLNIYKITSPNPSMQALQSKDWKFAPREILIPPNLHAWLLEQLYLQKNNLFLWTPVLIALGIGLYFSLPTEPPVLFGLAAFLLSASILVLIAPARTKSRTGQGAFLFSLSISLVVAGFLTAQIRTASINTHVLEKRLGPVNITGTIKSVEILEGKKGSRIILENPEIDNRPPDKTPQRIRLQLRADQNIAPGQKIKALATLNPPSGPVIPGGFDFRRHLYFQKIGAVGFIYRAPEIQEPNQSTLNLETLRQSINQRITKILPAQQAGIVTALITGHRKQITDNDNSAMRDAGLAHILAISGLHVGFIAGFIFFSARLFMASIPPLALNYPIKKIAAIIAFAGAIFYMLLAGTTVPTQRAVLMSGIIFLAVILDRSPISLRLVAFAALCILLSAPESLLSASFQMSFGAVTALVAFYEATRNFWSKTYSKAGFARKATLYILGVATTTLIASFATAPFALYHFQQVSALGSISNLIAVPILAFWVMPCAILSILLMPFGLDTLPLQIMGQGCAQILSIAHWSADLPSAAIHTPEISFPAFIMLCIAALVIILWRGAGKILALPLIIAAVFSAQTKTHPDILIAASHNIFAFKTDQSTLYATSLSKEKFVRENWERALGLNTKILPTDASAKQTANAPKCDAQACRLEIKGKKISFVKQPYALQADCIWADIVISQNPIKTRCPAKVKLDKFDTWKNGAYAIWIKSNGTIQIKNTRDQTGQRPWGTK
ncbi:MAG: ComEC family competence protein [Alphaproteobacteria bacterium]|nr:ComEC family competence protein [Alphaproteobacteria bacterium]